MNPRNMSRYIMTDPRSPGERKSENRKARVAELMAKGHTRARAMQLAKQHK